MAVGVGVEVVEEGAEPEGVAKVDMVLEEEEEGEQSSAQD